MSGIILTTDNLSQGVSLVNANQRAVVITNQTKTIQVIQEGMAPKYLVATIGNTGPVGPSAYDVALENGFVGTEAAWLFSLRGEDASSLIAVDPNPANRLQNLTEGLYVPPVAEAEFIDLTIIFENALI